MAKYLVVKFLPEEEFGKPESEHEYLIPGSVIEIQEIGPDVASQYPYESKDWFFEAEDLDKYMRKIND